MWKRSLSKVFLRKKAGGLLKEGESDVIEQQQKVFYHPFYKPPSKNIPTMMKMSDLNSTITRLWMVRAPSLFYYDFFILLWSLELKRQSGRQPARCFSFVFHCRYVARLPPQSLALPSPLSPPSQVILIKSVSLAWQAKIIGEGFWMPFTLNSGRFFPFSCFSFTLTASAITPPLPPLISCHAVTYLPFLHFFSPSIVHPNVKYGLTSAYLRGRLLVNCKFWPTLQFIWNYKSGREICRSTDSVKVLPLKKFLFWHLARKSNVI